MSIEAITFAKSRPVTVPMTRLLLFIIAENTFNDTGMCKVGQAVLVDETCASERTVREHLGKLEAAGVIRVHARPKASGGRLNDAIELVGFLQWLAGIRGKPEPANGAASAEPAGDAGSPVPEPANRLPVRYKDKSPVPKYPVRSNARASALPTTDKGSFEKNEKPKPLPDDWKLPDEWEAEAAEQVPGRETFVLVSASHFARYNRDRLTVATESGWRELWERWWSLEMAKSPEKARANKIKDWSAGPKPRDTEESVKDMIARCIREGTYVPPKPAKVRA